MHKNTTIDIVYKLNLISPLTNMQRRLTPKKKYIAYEFNIIKTDLEEKAVLHIIYKHRENFHNFLRDELSSEGFLTCIVLVIYNHLYLLVFYNGTEIVFPFLSNTLSIEFFPDSNSF